MEEIQRNSEFILQVDIDKAENSRLPWNMLEHNQVPGLLPFQYYYKNDKVCFQYVMGQLQPVAEYFQSKNADFDTLYLLCKGVMEIVEGGEEFFLKPEEYLMQIENIYWNRPAHKICLCYLPGSAGNLQEGYTALIEYLLQHTDHKDRKAVAFIYELYDRLTSDCFSVEELLEYFSSCRKSEETITKDSSAKSYMVSRGVSNVKYSLVYCGRIWRDSSFWKEGVGSYVLPEKNRILIGRGRKEDIVIPCPEISREQAVLFWKDGQLFLVDSNSANGTYLNNKKISGKDEVPCREGDCIRFANHSFKLVCQA